MMRFPIVAPGADPPVRRMTLAEYARFSERCLHGNASVTPANCLTRRADERDMPRPFRLTRCDQSSP